MTLRPRASASIDRARDIVNQLLGCGVTDAVLAPGSRSGPLALALHAADAQRLIRLHVRIDEREAAFLALGTAKSSRRPVPVITTSGTAVANLHPALLEAHHARVQLLAVTADRPAELRGTGANQTTDQRTIFPGIPFIEDVSDLGRSDGSQHFNIEFGEPLIEPTEWKFTDPSTAATPDDAAPTYPPVLVHSGPRTVVIAGDNSGPIARRTAEAGGLPLLAEPTSGARAGAHAVTAGRLLLGHQPLADRIERVISFGHATLSRPVTALLGRTDIDIVHLGDQATFPVRAGDNVTFAGSLDVQPAGEPSWLATWQQADQRANGVIASCTDGASPLDVARTVHRAVPPGGLLVVGASNPIRDLDLVAAPTPVGEKRLTIANRGLAGIDGVISTAIGAALGRHSSRALAFVGDLTFLHGSNGLLIGPDEPRPDLTIVVANDRGGSIFSTLEQGSAEYADAFERVYATPAEADLSALCRGFGVPHQRVLPADLHTALRAGTAGISVIEVMVDRKQRRGWSRAIAAAVAEQLRSIR